MKFLEARPKNERSEPEYDGEDYEDPFADFGDKVVLTDDDLPF